MRFSIGQSWRRGLRACTLKWSRFGGFTRILLTIIHLLLKLFRFLLVGERETCKTFLKLEGVEKGSILIIVERVINFLIPYDPTIGTLDVVRYWSSEQYQDICTYRNINQLDPKRVTHQVVRQYCRALQSSIHPLLPIWISNIESHNSDSLNLIRGFGYSPLDSLFVIFREHIVSN